MNSSELIAARPSLPVWAAEQLATLRFHREKARSHGEDVGWISFGYHNCLLLAADDTGAYHFRFGPRGNVTMQCVGHPSVVLESIVFGRA